MIRSGSIKRRFAGTAALACALSAFCAASAHAQSSNQSSATNSYYGSVQAVKPTPGVMQLSLDDAIQFGLQNNLALTLARDQQVTAAGQKLQALNNLLPILTLHGQTGVHQYNLEASGFKASLLPVFERALGGGVSAGSFQFITKVDVTQGQVNLSQPLFNLPSIEQYRAAKASESASFYNMQSSRGLVVLNVGTAYLQALAAGAQVDYAQALLKTDETLLYQAVAEHQAGTAANLDELRARVQYQTQQQVVIADQNAFEKAKIALEREIGVPPGQRIQLTDTSPYAELEATTIEKARQEAYANRQDYQSMQQQIRSAQESLKAAKHERLPTLNFNGFYGVQGISGGLYHGIFSTVGEIDVPIFREARLRGDRQTAEAQFNNAVSQFADLKERIDQQLRDSLLDIEAQAKLVQVARSNLDLATTELEQTTDRFQAGIEDNLPVIDAQSTLANAQTNYVNTVYQYNQAKLGLARNLGIIDTQYKAYLKGGPPQGGK